MNLEALHACRQVMETAGCAPWQWQRFQDDFAKLDHPTLLPEVQLEPLGHLPRGEDLPGGSPRHLDRTLAIKLNGGLGTSMGLTGPKSLLPVRDGKSFLDLLAAQIEWLRSCSGQPVPLLLMNSFATRAPSLERWTLTNPHDLPVDFLQSQVPKLTPDTFPAHHATRPELAWCPPGHGEIYAALDGTGLRRQLLQAGYRWAFVSNIDNLGATLDLGLLDWFAESGLPFAMEVTPRTELDRKGGHLTRREGRLTLRERAQTDPVDLPAFEDIERHRYFNTNNLWVNLEAWDAPPPLPLIVNRKTLDPTDPHSAPVLQLESAMGAAISHWPEAAAISVPRSRFLPVKTLSDLLLLRSDLYALNQSSELQRVGSEPLPAVHLDPAFFGSYSAFQQRVLSIPSLRGCRSLRLEGDVYLSAEQDLKGEARLTAAL